MGPGVGTSGLTELEATTRSALVVNRTTRRGETERSTSEEEERMESNSDMEYGTSAIR